jgi:hypothetical protein
VALTFWLLLCQDKSNKLFVFLIFFLYNLNEGEIKLYNREYFFEKINRDGFDLCNNEFKDEFEYYFDLFRVVDAQRVEKEDIDGIILIEENIDFRILFLDFSTGEYNVMAKYVAENDAFDEYSKIIKELE